MPDFAAAVQLHQSGQAERAAELYREILAAEPGHAGALHLLGVVHLQQEEFERAVEYIGQAIAIEPNKAVYFNNYGAALHGLGRHVEALACFHRAMAIRPEYADAVSNVGMAYESLGQLDAAAEHFRRALEIAPQHQDARTKYAALVSKRGDTAEALRLCEEELSQLVSPDVVAGFPTEPHSARSGDRPEHAAESEGPSVVAGLPTEPHSARSGDWPEHVGESEGLRALTLPAHRGEARKRVDLHVRMGNLLLGSGKSLEAVEQYEQALALDPQSSAALFNLGNAYHEQHRVEKAKEMFARAAGLGPSPRPSPRSTGAREKEGGKGRPLWQLRAEVCCPAVFQSAAEIDEFCGSLSETLDRWRESPPKAKWQDLVHAGAFPNFTYSYLGRNVRPLKEKFATFYQHYFRDLPEPQGSGLAGKRRLGIVVTHRHEGIFLRCLAGVIRELSPDEFELVVICSPQSVKVLREGLVGQAASLPASAANTSSAASKLLALRFVTIPNALEEAARVIRGVRCDVLYFWEAGSDALNYFLPFCRLAPVQATSHGSQITSGNPAIDWFYSSRLMEDGAGADPSPRPSPRSTGAREKEPVEQAASLLNAEASKLLALREHPHYTEKLWLSETLLMNQSRLPKPPGATRAKFGLPEGRTLYLSLQNPLKFHPDFDPLLAGVLRGNPRGVAVLLKGTFDFAEAELRRRFVRTLPDVQDRVIFLPFQKFSDYCSLLALADVALDPLHFGHGSSAYDLFSFNVPLVTLPTALNVGQVGAACYKKMGLPELAATDAEQYIAQAVRLGRDADYRRHVVAQITAATPKLFDDRQALEDHARFFRNA